MHNDSVTKVYVDHPRYGNQPISSEYSFTNEEIEKAYWGYSGLRYLPNTAIPADTSKQNFAIYPRSVYVDIEEQCEVCGKPFLFFALEQKYWFEQLRFWIDAHCTRCITCRKQNQATKLIQKQYQELVGKNPRTEQETNLLKAIARELHQQGYIRNINKLKSISKVF